MRTKKQIKTVVVLGMHRSGTSMVAGVLKILGINMGEELEEGNEWNPLGYFENKKFMAINKKITNEKEGLIINVPTLDEILLKKERFIYKIDQLIKQEESALWGWKDPRTSLTIDLFLPFLKNPYFIICFRNPLQVAYSLQKRDGTNINEGIELAALYNQRILDFFKRHKQLKKLYLSYEEIVNNPEKELDKIIDYLEINPDKLKYKKALKFILPKRKIKLRVKKYYIKDYFNKAKKHPEKIPKFILKKIFRYKVNKVNNDDKS